MRAVVFLYGLVCYGVLFGTFLYAIGFLANFGVPRSVDAGGPEVPFGGFLARSSPRPRFGSGDSD